MTVVFADLQHIGTGAALVALGVAVLTSAATGFSLGYLLGRRDPLAALLKTSQKLNRLCKLAVERLDSARAACDALTKHADLFAGSPEVDRFEAARTELISAMGRAATGLGIGAEAPAEPEPDAPGEIEIEWQLEESAGDELPSRETFDLNLGLLVSACDEANAEAGLLLVRLDRADSLAKRLGDAGVRYVFGQLSRAVIRSVRDEDVVFEFDGLTLAVLFGGLDRDKVSGRVATIRDSVRHCVFRSGAEGPEVFATASFGYGPCRPSENARLVIDRAIEALTRSERRGRNLVHLHDGSRPVVATP
ncbi:GGDEF domain-containing protein [Stratiformator vulcanicus]|uniref:Response regulator PleD n=1 Tax=Stratiformator vulcanicus TaxID=2527980 RepID=A0A517R4J7_9PLAN|nr:diguanylate cyclase [Stratiformator vulcanicus]QDT38796.1 response regulator PleD [Stratiformator vulcanicus]